jgi:hypothetical protein
VLERFQELSYYDDVLSKDMTALAQFLYKERFMILKADISIPRFPGLTGNLLLRKVNSIRIEVRSFMPLKPARRPL